MGKFIDLDGQDSLYVCSDYPRCQMCVSNVEARSYATPVAGPTGKILDKETPLTKSTTSDPANPKQAFGDKKVPLYLVPPALEYAAAKGFIEGRKYGPFNWRDTKVKMTTYIGAIQRHLGAIRDGEDVDPESTTGKLHLEGLAANVAILADAFYGGFLIDDRPTPGPMPRLLLTPKEDK